MRAFLDDRVGNPASTHGFGQSASRAVEEARRRVKTLCGGAAGDLIFTGSGTEAVFLGTAGLARAVAPRGGHVVISAVEHRAGQDAGRHLESLGFLVSRVRPDGHGYLDPAAVAAVLRADTALASIMHANNETGAIHPVAEIAEVCRERGVRMHVDAVQSSGKIPVDADGWGVDALSLAAHKLGGPQGVGALWRRRGTPIEPLLPGPQESGIRGGTLNVAGIVGFGRAAEAAGDELEIYRGRLTERRCRLEAALAARVSEARVTASEIPRLPNTVHLTFDPAVGPDLAVALDMEGYAVSAGSACRSGSEEPSPVLLAMGYPPERARTSVRVSFGLETTDEELDGFVSALARTVRSRVAAGARP
jgi:cysteine desulfurase